MELGLTDRVALVTGGGSGIGLETVLCFLREGARVVAVDLDIGELAGLDPARVLPLQADLSDAAAPQAIVAAALERFGQIDALFNNAGILRFRESFLSVTDEQWQATFELNLMGYIRMARAVLPPMLAAGRGTLVHCASQAARMPPPSSPDYSISKAAVLMLSKILAQEFTAKGVRSNVVSPAHIRTPIFDRPGGVIENLLKRYGVSDRDEAIRLFLRDNRMPAARLGKPSEVANMVLYLSSDISEYITGADFPVDGGVRQFV